MDELKAENESVEFLQNPPLLFGVAKQRGGSKKGQDFGSDVAKQGGISQRGDISRNPTDVPAHARRKAPDRRANLAILDSCHLGNVLFIA